MLRIGISGKRNILPGEKDQVAKRIEEAIRKILSKNGAAGFTGVTALATGADTIFVDVVTRVFKMPLHVVLPFAPEEYKKDFTTHEEELELDFFLKKNQEITIVTAAIPVNKDERSEAYLAAGRFIADNSDDMVFVWDERKPNGKGGTGEIIGYYSETKQKFPVDYICIAPAKEDPLHRQIRDEYELSNDLAMRCRDNYKLIWRLAIILGWLAVLCFAANTAFHFEGIANVIGVSLECSLVIVTFCLIIRAKRKDYHGRYLSYRSRAETLRLLRYYYHSNNTIKISGLTRLEDKDLSNLVEKINAAICKTSYTSKWYANYAIKSLIEDQKKYHSDKIVAIGSKFHLFEKFNIAIASLFMANLLVHLANAIFEFIHHTEGLADTIHEITTFISIMLPATYAVFEGVIYFQEWAILKKYSSSAEKSLCESLQELPLDVGITDDTTCFDKQLVTLNLVSSTMLTDNKNWHLILEDKNNYHWVV